MDAIYYFGIGLVILGGIAVFVTRKSNAIVKVTRDGFEMDVTEENNPAPKQ